MGRLIGPLRSPVAIHVCIWTLLFCMWTWLNWSERTPMDAVAFGLCVVTLAAGAVYLHFSILVRHFYRRRYGQFAAWLLLIVAFFGTASYFLFSTLFRDRNPPTVFFLNIFLVLLIATAARFVADTLRGRFPVTPGPDAAVAGRHARGGSEGRRTVLIRSGTKTYPVAAEDILYLRSAGNYLRFVTASREILSLMTMPEALELLPRDRFCRVHRSYSVNLDHIEVIDGNRLKIGALWIPVGATYRPDFRDRTRAPSHAGGTGTSGQRR
jgi:hypothetical protein